MALLHPSHGRIVIARECIDMLLQLKIASVQCALPATDPGPRVQRLCVTPMSVSHSNPKFILVHCISAQASCARHATNCGDVSSFGVGAFVMLYVLQADGRDAKSPAWRRRGPAAQRPHHHSERGTGAGPPACVCDLPLLGMVQRLMSI